MRWPWQRDRVNVTVKTHVAQFFQDDGELGGPLYVFIKITNLGRRPVQVTHIWFEPPDYGSGVWDRVHVINQARPLPTWLNPAEQYEVWTPAKGVFAAWGGDEALDPHNNVIHRNALSSGRAMLTSGEVIAATPNDTVPSVGFVAGPGSQPG